MAKPSALRLLLQPLGLANKRCVALVKFARDFCEQDWNGDARKLFSCGQYAKDAYDMFVRREMPEEPPQDLELRKYWRWKTSKQGSGGRIDDTPRARDVHKPKRERSRGTERCRRTSRHFSTPT
uniref:Uncharacterized protein n=1 Tax=Pinguiococcus pyrenoidosus TaxID=172671 RepID=A0A7R9UBY5_9STRA|mmetsp:Transcript_4883/g.19549  ORF Transcript_4883/g.19549 Transcript_4883/m.19549 type:complete len:124 (+) Transcript_4883:430-801(+)